MSNYLLKKLKTSWTKFDAVQVISIVANQEIQDYLARKKRIDLPILKSFLGVQNLSDPLPDLWNQIQKHPKQLKLFALIAAIFTHHSIINLFAEKYAKGKMRGLLKVEGGKQGTNLRRALIEAGAASKEYEKKGEVPYDLSPLYANGEVGKLFKHLLTERLTRVGHTVEELNGAKFYTLCDEYEFYKALSLTKHLFRTWLDGQNIDETQVQSEYSFKQLKVFQKIKAIKVNQWLNDWDDIDFKSPMREKPNPYFFLFKIDARLLKRISDVHRRKSEKPRIEELSVQRVQNESRTAEIKKYIEGGFPWSTIKKEDQKSPENRTLKMPGILPTAIIANILGEDQMRGSKKIKKSDLIQIEHANEDIPTIIIPERVFEDSWDPEVKPLEIIDGQHRLWAFDENEPISGNYELPVVAYYNLDRTWQAYMFYTINIKPVKINTSLGYDLYPLLRTQKWLENSRDGLLAYRENRAQEIVEVLWRFPNSVWKNRINMLGEAGGPTMSQAAFIRALTSTFLKNNKGLFGDVLLEKNNQVITWNRAQQAAFILILWRSIEDAIRNCNNDWAIKLRLENQIENIDLAFAGKNSLLSRDQGVRGASMFANDFFYQAANTKEWDFNKFHWSDDIDEELTSDNNIQQAIDLFYGDTEFVGLISLFATRISLFDWRTSSANFDTEQEKNKQMRYKGSSGYTEIAKGLKELFLNSDNQVLHDITSKILS
jgi:hypothetical protein